MGENLWSSCLCLSVYMMVGMEARAPCTPGRHNTSGRLSVHWAGHSGLGRLGWVLDSAAPLPSMEISRAYCAGPIPEESHKDDLLSFETAGTVAVRVHTPVLANVLNGFPRWASVGGRCTARQDRPPCSSTQRTLWLLSLQPTSV